MRYVEPVSRIFDHAIMVTTLELLLILGPPAAGKSTIGKEAAKQLGRRFLNLDDYVRGDFDSTNSLQPMTDFEVDAALDNLFNDCMFGDLVEFSHHDYKNALKNLQQKIPQSPSIAVVAAEREICLHRNQLRKDPVPVEYVERCIVSSRLLQDELTNSSNIDYCVINSDNLDLKSSVDSLVKFALERI